MKIRTLDELQDALDKQMSWRVKEILDLKVAVRSSGGLAKPTLIRAGSALLYAHWEGFIKAASSSYIHFINSQRVPYGDLNDAFVVMGMKAHLNTLRHSGSYDGNISALRYIRNHMDERFGVNLAGVIDTESNLSSKVFANIATSLCIPLASYATKSNFIDESLVQRRNKIAHGERIDISVDDWRKLADDVLGLIRNYKTDIENAASSSSYRAPPSK